jgi:predicted RNA-binding protein with TRAM domain
MRQEREPPVKQGEEVTGRIDSVGEKGDGVMRVKGFIVFVPNVQRGDYVKVKITKVLPKVSFGQVVEKMQPPSPQELFKAKEEKKEDFSHLLTTEGDSEDFGEEDEDEE